MEQAELQRYALLGATETLRKLEAETQQIHTLFPETKTVVAISVEPEPKKRTMSPEMRKKVSRRMKAYWRKQREA